MSSTTDDRICLSMSNCYLAEHVSREHNKYKISNLANILGLMIFLRRPADLCPFMSWFSVDFGCLWNSCLSLLKLSLEDTIDDSE